MRNIVTITFNPAIDETVEITDFRADTVNRVDHSEKHAGGKGVNVATFLADYGLKPTVSGFLGRENEDVFTDHFSEKEIIDRFVRIDGATRVGIKIIDKNNRSTTDINYPGISPTGKDLENLYHSVGELAANNALFVISGSVPGGTDASVYAHVMDIIKTKGCESIVDTSGEAFSHALRNRPRVIKPNNHELSEYFGKELTSIDDITDACRSFFEAGIEYVIVSMGSKGALFLTETESLHACSPNVKVISTVGAGDAMVAGITAGIVQGMSLEETARLSSAFSLYAISHIELGIHDKAVLDSYIRMIQVKKL